MLFEEAGGRKKHERNLSPKREGAGLAKSLDLPWYNSIQTRTCCQSVARAAGLVYTAAMFALTSASFCRGWKSSLFFPSQG